MKQPTGQRVKYGSGQLRAVPIARANSALSRVHKQQGKLELTFMARHAGSQRRKPTANFAAGYVARPAIDGLQPKSPVEYYSNTISAKRQRERELDDGRMPI